ncbi:hypothetical protein [Saliphagus infecundisoli]|uniref:Methyl-accepting chemotaxis protein n=1 Tax=Saliphagus infecundisoli TaxID=1849069 RepID=A0ABD5QJQ6_9EURY|nr:hypothetical protein [Saliphagus infecundisoli]
MQETLEGEGGVARIEQVSDDLQATVQQFESHEEALRERFQAPLE